MSSQVQGLQRMHVAVTGTAVFEGIGAIVGADAEQERGTLSHIGGRGMLTSEPRLARR